MALLRFGGSDCEALRDGWLAQPANSVSSLAYVVAAVLVLRQDRRLVWVAAALALVGVGSFLYHGPMPAGAGVAHDGSLVLLAAAIVHAAWRRLVGLPPVTTVAVGAVAVVLYALARTNAPLCRPDGVLQGHAGWHILTAAALAMSLARGAPRPSGA